MNGGSGAEYIYTRAGADVVNAGGGDDTVYGDLGNDTLRDGSGSDYMHGGADTVNAGGGNDIVYGEAGDDFIEGGANSDSLNGGLGLDTFDFNLGSGTDTVYDFTNDQDTLRIDPGYGFATAAAVVAATTAVGNDAVVGLGGGNSIVLVNYLAANSIANLGDDIIIL